MSKQRLVLGVFLLLVLVVAAAAGVYYYAFAASKNTPGSTSTPTVLMNAMNVRDALKTRNIKLPAAPAGKMPEPNSLPILPSTLALLPRYSDSAGSVVSEENAAANKTQEDKIAKVVQAVETAVIDCVLGSGDISRARSYIGGILRSQVTAKALTSANEQGLFTRMYAFHIPVVLACIRVPGAAADPGTQEWLKNMHADHTTAYQSRKNNQKAWWALDTILMSKLLEDANMYQQASTAWKDICNELISADGSVQAETERGARASKYYEYFFQAMVYTSFVGGFLTHPRLHAMLNCIYQVHRPALADSNLPWLFLYHGMFKGMYVSPSNMSQYQTDVKRVMADTKTRSLGGYAFFFAPDFLSNGS